MMFSDFTRKVTMQNLYHDGGFSSMGMSLRAMNQYSKGLEEIQTRTDTSFTANMLVKIYPENPNQKEIDKVVKVLQDGGLVVYPTDTVYAMVVMR